MVADSSVQTSAWAALERPTPDWFTRAKLGIFVHWGPYSVPAWAEPTGELGTISSREWFTHNPYAEWYFNTIRLDGSPAQRHHQQVYGGAPYDDFLDQWQAENFDPDDVVRQVRESGADYLVLTTKHHDGVTLWDAAGTGDRNTVRRGPHRDLVEAYAQACRRAGVRFGAYYSGGLDWHVRPFPPHELLIITDRPVDAEYAAYAEAHVRDLVDRYHPDVLWNDIEWPDAGKNFDEHGIGRMFADYYDAVPDGLVNDRWQVPHHDFVTSEYQHGLDLENEPVWENCRGLGLSFGYNQVEGPAHALSGSQVIRHLVDVVVRGGRLLIGVGPKADGTLPSWQAETLAAMGRWMGPAAGTLQGIGEEVEVDVPAAWVRVGRTPTGTRYFVDSDDAPTVVVPLGHEPRLLTPDWGHVRPLGNDSYEVDLAPDRPGPVVLELD